jgi:hypothetical protein
MTSFSVADYTVIVACSRMISSEAVYGGRCSMV